MFQSHSLPNKQGHWRSYLSLRIKNPLLLQGGSNIRADSNNRPLLHCEQSRKLATLTMTTSLQCKKATDRGLVRASGLLSCSHAVTATQGPQVTCTLRAHTFCLPSSIPHNGPLYSVLCLALCIHHTCQCRDGTEAAVTPIRFINRADTHHRAILKSECSLSFLCISNHNSHR